MHFYIYFIFNSIYFPDSPIYFLLLLFLIFNFYFIFIFIIYIYIYSYHRMVIGLVPPKKVNMSGEKFLAIINEVRDGSITVEKAVEKVRS